MKVTTSANITAAVLKLTVQASTPDVAAALATQTLADARSFIGSQITAYALDPIESTSAQPEAVLDTAALALLTGLILLTGVGALVMGRRALPDGVCGDVLGGD